MPPQVNATLTHVAGAGEGGGTLGDFGHAEAGGPVAPGASKWTGILAAYYSEKTVVVAGADGPDQLLQRTLIIDTGDVADLIDTDDVLTFALDGGAPQTGTAAMISRARLAGIPAELQTTRLTLADA